MEEISCATHPDRSANRTVHINVSNMKMNEYINNMKNLLRKYLSLPTGMIQKYVFM
jgi:hypothetical protein